MALGLHFLYREHLRLLLLLLLLLLLRAIADFDVWAITPGTSLAEHRRR